MVALYDYDPTENSPNVDGDVSETHFTIEFFEYDFFHSIFYTFKVNFETFQILKRIQFNFYTIVHYYLK